LYLVRTIVNNTYTGFPDLGTIGWSDPVYTPTITEASDILALTSGGTNNTHALSFSSPVVDPILHVFSLGHGPLNLVVTWNFSSPFTILSTGSEFGEFPNSGLSNPEENLLLSGEGSGTIQFSGTFDSLVWTSDVTEFFHGFHLGVADVIPEPSSLALVDIKPGSDSNSVSLKSKGLLLVAILGTDDFDVDDVDISTLLFGDPNGGPPVSPVRSAVEEVSGDAFDDLILKFSTAELVANEALGLDTMEGLLTGALFDGTLFEGMDSIRIVPPNRSNENSLQVSGAPEPTTAALALAALCLAIGRRRSH
jgi:MYXO-CTERM domain-containing protein